LTLSNENDILFIEVIAMMYTLITFGIFFAFYYLVIRPIRKRSKHTEITTANNKESKNWASDPADPLYQETFHRQASKEW
jgi:hypothetical protein